MFEGHTARDIVRLEDEVGLCPLQHIANTFDEVAATHGYKFDFKTFDNTNILTNAWLRLIEFACEGVAYLPMPRKRSDAKTLLDRFEPHDSHDALGGDECGDGNFERFDARVVVLCPRHMNFSRPIS